MVVQYVMEGEDGGLYTVYNEQEATHVILDMEDYAKLKEASGSGQVDVLISNAKNVSVGGVQQDAGRVRELELALRAARNRAAYEHSMNEGFRRIFKERANADRKLKPKKEHTGYVIQVSAEKEKFGFVNKRRQMFGVMETVLQTPYDAQFNLGQVKIETLELTQKQPDGSRLVDMVGLGPMYRPQAANAGLSTICNEVVAFTKEQFEQARKENLILFRQFKFNAKAGYWEIILTHMAPLTCYDANMMPPAGKNKDTEPAEKEA